MSIKINQSTFRSLFISLFLFGFIFLTLITIQANFLYQNLEFLAKTNSDFYDMNGRLFIWGPTLAYILDFNLNLFFGFGEFGNYESKVSLLYSHIFEGWSSSNMKTAHNTVFTTILDYGFFGLFVLVSILISYTKKLYKIKNNELQNVYKILFSTLTYLIICGQFDSIIGYYFRLFPLLYFHIWLVMEYIFQKDYKYYTP